MSASRDIDTPDTIVSSSSPECVIPSSIQRFPGLRLIDDESDEDSESASRFSPQITILIPIPIRPGTGSSIRNLPNNDKENLGTSKYELKKILFLSEVIDTSRSQGFIFLLIFKLRFFLDLENLHQFLRKNPKMSM